MPPLRQQPDSRSFIRVTSPNLLLWEQILSQNPATPPLHVKKDRESEREREGERKKESVQLSAKQTGDHKVGL